MAYIQNLTLSPGIVLNVDGPKIEVLVNGARYGPDYSLSGVQNAIQQQIDTYNGLVATLKPNDPKLAQVNSIISTLNSAKSLLNPGGPADTAIKKDNEEAEAERLAAEAARKKEAEAAKTTATPTPTPTAETTAAAPPPANTKPSLAGAASDDSGAGQPKPAGSAPGPVPSPAAAAGAGGTTAATQNSTAASPTQPTDTSTSAKPDTNATTTNENFSATKFSSQPVDGAGPGKRLTNPLGEFSSSTYQITLYMITTDAYEAFVQNGRKKINVLNEVTGGGGKGGAYIIAQSGGLNEKEKRAPAFAYDYGIDNLKIEHYLPGMATGKELNISDIEFQIIEPYGFSFLTNLRKASDAIMEYQKTINGGPQDPTRQFFVLGIRFLGYDSNGNVVSSSGDRGLFEFFIDINIKEVKFKVNGKTVIYSVSATQSSQYSSFKVSRGFIHTNKTVEANTVGVALDQLMAKLNEEQNNLAKGEKPAVEHPNQYEIVWLPGTEEIYNASLISEARLEKYRWKSSGAKKTEDSNVAKEVNQQQADEKVKQFTFKNGKSIPDAITEVIKQSSYLEDALRVVYTSDIESDPNTKSNPTLSPAYQKQRLSWYTCTPQISEIKWDNKVKNWSYKISYLIGKYDTPVVDTPVVDNTGRFYPGPHKRYDYWYTGENRDIISYEQTLNTAYNMIVLDGASIASTQNTDPSKSAGTPTPNAPNMKTPQPTLGSQGYSLEAQNSFLTALFDPNSYAEAEITILGDPDYLIRDTSYDESTVYNKYYGSDSFSINPSGGQVFIEIDFKEAVDYTSDTGTLNINDSILFFKYPDNILNNKTVKGVSYLLTSVTNMFNNGVFKQKLGARINLMGAEPLPDSAYSRSNRTPENATTANTTGPNPGNDKTTSAGVSGTPADKPTTPKTNVSPAKTDTTGATAQPTVATKNGPVANDDGGSGNAPASKPIANAGRETLTTPVNTSTRTP